MRYQIRTNGHGLTLVEAESVHDALSKFFESMGYVIKEVTGDTVGVIFVRDDGVEFYTEPPI